MFRVCKWEFFMPAVLLAVAATANGQVFQRQGQQPNNQGNYNRPRAQPASQQRTTQRYYSATPGQNQQYGQATTSDHKIAVMLINCNEAEIKLSRYAARHAESDEVRQFADQLVQDHQSMVERLHRFAPEVNTQEATASNDRSGGDEEGRDQQQDQQQDQQWQQNRGTRQWNDNMVAHQIGERIVRRSRDELSEKEGNEFDVCFVGQQMVTHQQSLAKLEVLRQYASSQLRDVIDEATETVEGHEQQARDLIKRLKDEGQSASSNRRNSSSDDRSSREARRTTSTDDDSGRDQHRSGTTSGSGRDQYRAGGSGTSGRDQNRSGSNSSESGSSRDQSRSSGSSGSSRDQTRSSSRSSGSSDSSRSGDSGDSSRDDR